MTYVILKFIPRTYVKYTEYLRYFDNKSVQLKTPSYPSILSFSFNRISPHIVKNTIPCLYVFAFTTLEPLTKLDDNVISIKVRYATLGNLGSKEYFVSKYIIKSHFRLYINKVNRVVSSQSYIRSIQYCSYIKQSKLKPQRKSYKMCIDYQLSESI